jgi:hypothetical protein
MMMLGMVVAWYTGPEHAGTLLNNGKAGGCGGGKATIDKDLLVVSLACLGFGVVL